MGSDDDAMHRRDDAHEWGWFVDDSGRIGYEFSVSGISKEALDILWGKVVELPAGVEGESGADESAEAEEPGGVDKSDGMGHDAAMTTTGEDTHTVSNTVGPATGVLPLPMIDYIKWNHMAWDSEEVQPFDPEPGFWQTISEVGVPSSWHDIKVDYSGDTEVISSRAEELAAEATQRGVPVLAMPPLEWEGQGQDETAPMPVLEPTQVLPVTKPMGPKVRGGQRAANARQRAEARKRAEAAGKDAGSDQG